ncbi:hypothetical protein L1987_01721 [Smallanthus sonchifolius]|uniref:Uncharacterized protein n=1 Tax=Smallanthus sonchifolius TaxID=185202 RepID=A0ACB9K5R5_9ASTR|nr:hypothetical protein L1987_01721 [Smallanthus sonchifolius]
MNHLREVTTTSRREDVIDHLLHYGVFHPCHYSKLLLSFVFRSIIYKQNRRLSQDPKGSFRVIFKVLIYALSVVKGQAEPVDAEPLTRELLDTNKCYIFDCGVEVYVWLGRSTSLDERKAASGATEEYVRSQHRQKSHIIRVIENFEPVTFRSKFDSWPQSTAVTVSEDGRGKVAALLKRQGVNVKGLLKAAPTKEEPQPHIDCTGNLQVWHVNGQEKILLPVPDQSKFYTGDCYIYQYLYLGEDQEECLIGTCFGKQSIEDI